MTLRPRHLALLISILLTGCVFDKKQPTPPLSLAPSLSSVPRPDIIHPVLSEADDTIPDEPLEAVEDSDLPARPFTHHQHPFVRPPQPAATVPPATQAADPPEVSAIGQLSTPEPSDLQLSVKGSIDSTEHGLNTIGRSLNEQERKTASQIREFLKQAKEALNNGDIDGAKTLASKAKVLLSELNN
jgi:hypothetical protein